MALLERGNEAAVTDHGGSLGRARSLFPQAPEPRVDLSTGINPHYYPLFELPATACRGCCVGRGLMEWR